MKKITIYILTIIFISININAAQNTSSEQSSGNVNTQRREIQNAANFIVAKIDEEVVLMSDLRDMYIEYKARAERLNKPKPKLTFTLKKKLVKRLIEERFFLLYAKQHQLEVTEAQISKRINDIKTQYRIENDDELIVAASRSGSMGRIENLNQLREKIQRGMLIQKAQQHLIGAKFRDKIAAPTEQQMKNFYNKNPKYFYGPVKVKIQHLVLKLNEGAEFEEIEKMQKKIKMIMNKAKNGENFSSLVNKYADPTYRTNNGYISNQFLKRQELMSLFPKYVKYAFKLKKGQISPVIVDGNKRIIIKVADKKLKQLRPYVEVKNLIKRYLFTFQGRKMLDKWVKAQYNERLIKVFYDRLRIAS